MGNTSQKTNKEQPERNDELPERNHEHHSMNEEQPTMNEEQPTMNEEQPTMNEELPTMSDEPPAKKRKLIDGNNMPAGGYEDITELCQEKDRYILQLEEENKRLRESVLTTDEYKNLKRKYDEERTIKNDAVRRLNAIVSSKLRDKEQNVPDLSEQRRPTRIVEKMSELYDNQWTEAHGALERKRMHEEDIAKVLRNILMKSYKICKVTATVNYFEKVQRSIELPLQKEVSVVSATVLPEYLKQQIKEFRKCRAVHVVKDLEKALKVELETPHGNLPAIQKYISGCVEISWLMAVQDPPPVLSTESLSKFDTNMFKYYTRRGPYVDYVVWPALFLQEGGTVLAKGVAQGCDHSFR